MKNFFGIKLCACAFDDVFKDKFLKYFMFFFYFKRKEIKTNISKKKIKKKCIDKINSHPLKRFETRKYDKKIINK